MDQPTDARAELIARAAARAEAEPYFAERDARTREATAELIATAEQASRLPVDTTIKVVGPLQITARKLANQFIDGRSGWQVTGIKTPMTDEALFSLGRRWTVIEDDAP